MRHIFLDKPYHLEINSPASKDAEELIFPSDTLFMATGAGNFTTPSQREDKPSLLGNEILRVVSVEHIIWPDQGRPIQRVCVFIEEDGVPTTLSGAAEEEFVLTSQEVPGE